MIKIKFVNLSILYNYIDSQKLNFSSIYGLLINLFGKNITAFKLKKNKNIIFNIPSFIKYFFEYYYHLYSSISFKNYV